MCVCWGRRGRADEYKHYLLIAKQRFFSLKFPGPPDEDPRLLLNGDVPLVPEPDEPEDEYDPFELEEAPPDNVEEVPESVPGNCPT